MTPDEPKDPGGEGSLLVGVGVDENPDVRKAVRKALGVAYASLERDPALLIVSATSGYDLDELLEAVHMFAGPLPVVGGTSSNGLATESGIIRAGGRGRGVGVMALAGRGLSVGVGHAEVGSAPRRAGEAAAAAALAAAVSRTGSPVAALLFAPPGYEEAILHGVTSTLGRGVPLFGCTVADEDLSGRWAAFCGSEALPNGVVVAVLHGSFLAGAAFSTGYWTTSLQAEATGVTGRVISRLGGRPAAEVYAEWLGADVSELYGPRIHRYAAAEPLGVEEPRTRRVLVKEPGTASADGSLGLFGEVKEGDIIRMLSCTPESLISAAGAAAAEAMTRASLRPELVRGVLVAQGSGRVLLLGERAQEVVLQIRRVVGNAPLLGMAGFGEQSALPDGRPVHLNLAVSVMVLGG